MAKTQYSIKVTYNKVVGKANELENIARDIDKQREQLESCKRNLSGKWKGDSANQYNGKLDIRMQELSGIAKDVRATAAAVKSVAKSNYNADKKALELAKKRNK